MAASTQEARADGPLPRKFKGLTAIGISVANNCESYMQWHIERAAESGASEREVLEAVEVGIETAGGPGTVAARFQRSASHGDKPCCYWRLVRRWRRLGHGRRVQLRGWRRIDPRRWFGTH